MRIVLNNILTRMFVSIFKKNLTCRSNQNVREAPPKPQDVLLWTTMVCLTTNKSGKAVGHFSNIFLTSIMRIESLKGQECDNTTESEVAMKMAT